MFFIMKLMLIILFNETSARITQDVETTILPTWKPTKRNEILLTLKAFGKQIQLNLFKNDKTTSAVFKLWTHDAKDKTEEQQLNSSDSCYYYHNDRISSAVINICHKYGWEGLVLLENNTLQIRPLQDNFASLILTANTCVKVQTNISFGKLHLIKKSLQLFDNLRLHNIKLDNFKLKHHVQNTHKNLTIELAVFFDEAAYRTFMPILDEDTEKLRNMILAYVNNIQALLHHSSLGAPIDISLVHLAIMDKQPLDLTVSADNVHLLNSFCEYANNHNSPNDNNPAHWDLALYLTGLNIYRTKNKHMIFGTLASSFKNGLCTTNLSCVIVEIGVNRTINSGFASSITAAHEIGHLLGMQHDENVGPILCKSDYIMSTIRTRKDQVTWSECSRNITKELWNTKQCLRDRNVPEIVINLYPKLDHSRYDDLPGREWNAKAQCEIYFRNKDANVVSLLDMCRTLECKVPNQNNAFTGPALEGTYCDTYNVRFGHKKECRGGECVPITQPYVYKHFGTDNWSEWKIDSCKSGCLNKSKGVAVKRRFCTHGTNRTANCKGPYYDVILCDDTSYCAKKFRQTISEFTEKKCTEFSSLIENYTTVAFEILKQPGHQAVHDVKKPWIACTIYCRRKDMHDYYAPRLEMLGFNMNPYFPDGTWCHHENDQDYHCRQHYCLPFLTINIKK